MAVNVKGLSAHRPWPGSSAIHGPGQEPLQGQRLLQKRGSPKTSVPIPQVQSASHACAHWAPALKHRCP